jgi:hypothetical protein
MGVLVTLVLLVATVATASAKEACLRNESDATVFFTYQYKNQYGGTSIGAGEWINPGRKKCIKLPETPIEKMQAGPSTKVGGISSFLLEDCTGALPDKETTNYRASGKTLDEFVCERIEAK